MKDFNEISNKLLVCPTHQGELYFDDAVHLKDGVPLNDSKIKCAEGCEYSIKGGIPRFVPYENYASSFGFQWQKYRKTQLDSYTGQSISKKRLESSLNMPLEELKEKIVLEVGCGAGRFTEHLIEKSKFLVSADFSNAVDANLENCIGKKNYLLIQADINASPVLPLTFDLVICLGVIQHTPSPEQTIASLAKHVRPGGTLVIDHYTANSRLNTLSRLFSLAYPLRAVLKRLRPEVSLKAAIALTAISNIIRKRTYKHLWLDCIAARLFPTACYYAVYPELDPKILYEWHELDTFDMLTDYYKHFRSIEEIRSCLEKLGFINIYCGLGGTGLIARATCPK